MKLNPVEWPAQLKAERWVRGPTAHHPVPKEARYMPGHPGLVGIPLVMLRRMAAMAQWHNATMDDVIAVRARSVQARLYREYLAGDGPLAARPGYSWHGVRDAQGHEACCAVDVPAQANPTWERLGRQWIKKPAPQTGYGLCLPLTVAKVGALAEPWHWQPVETLNVPAASRDRWLDADDAIYGYPKTIRAGDTSIWYTEFERLTGTRDIKAFQRAHGLKADGICGPATWAKAYGMEV